MNRSGGLLGRVRNLIGSDVERFWRGLVPLLTALTLLNASNYIFHVAISRLLGPSLYGGVAALLAVMLLALTVGPTLGAFEIRQGAPSAPAVHPVPAQAPHWQEPTRSTP